MSKTPNFDAALDNIFTDLKPHTRVCKETGESFGITERDIEMLKLLRVPPPQLVWWASIRRKRAFVAGFDLFRKTMANGRSFVTFYDPETSVSVLPKEEWQSDRFEPLAFGRDISPAASFFEQWGLFSSTVPRPSITQDSASVNSEWTVYSTELKNCYGTWGGGMNEDALYADHCGWLKFSSDMLVCTHCDWSYDNVTCHNSSKIFFCKDCEDCIDVYFGLGCKNCRDCFGCTNLRYKKFCFFNEQLSKEEYRSRFAAIELADNRVLAEWRTRASAFWKTAFRKLNNVQHSENAHGDDIKDSNDVSGYTLYSSEKAYWSALDYQSRNVYDVTGAFDNQFCYNTLNDVHSSGCKITIDCTNCIDCEYSELLSSCENCFGCVGLKFKKFCIFNRQYSEGDYWALVDNVKTAMLERGEYGQFFPYKLSPFAYNCAHAGASYPLAETDASALGARWYSFDSEKITSALSISELSERLTDTTDAVLKNSFECPVTGRAFRIVNPEIALHREIGIALPRVHPTVRRIERMKQLFLGRLYRRVCDRCGATEETRFPPEYSGELFCGECYEKAVLEFNTVS